MGFATPSMTDALKEMWRTCFGDDAVYTDFIFSRLLMPENILVHCDEKGNPAAMLCLQPFQLMAGQEQAKGAYIYGVCTLPQQRGKGLSTTLLEEAHRHLVESGYALSALVPASEGLFRFYGDRGYETFFQIKQATWRAGDIPAATQPCVLTPTSFEELADLRDRWFGDCVPFVRWGRDYLTYIGAECTLLGGEVLRIGNDGYAVCYPVDNRLLIKELAVADHGWPPLSPLSTPTLEKKNICAICGRICR